MTLARTPMTDAGPEGAGVACRICIKNVSGDIVEAEAVATQAYAAIDKVVSLIRARPQAAPQGRKNR